MLYHRFDFSDSADYLALGKTYTKEKALVLPWNDSGFSFHFYGTGFVLHFGAYPCPEVPYVRVWVDGRPSQRFAVTNGSEKILIDGLCEGAHTAKILRVTEGMDPIIVKNVAITGLEPKLLNKPAERPLRLAFIGDSITCGYGVVGASTTAGYLTDEQDSSRSYAYLTAELLDAEIQLSGASGKGIVANCNGDRADMTLRQAFAYKDRQGGEWDHSAWIPDLTVINAGTNDAWGGVSDEEFTETAQLLMQEVRAAFPGKPIIWCYGVMDQTKMGAVEAAVNAFNNTYGNAYYLPVDTMYGKPEEVGGGGHPNTVTSDRVSKILAAKIKEVLGI